MLQTIKNALKTPEIRTKLFYTLLIILIYRIGCFVPVPGLDVGQMGFTTYEGNDFLQMLSTITGGSLQNGTIFALGIIPFINSFIIMQLLTLIIPKLEKLSKEGEEGRKKITEYTRYFAILLGIIQAIGVMFSWRNYIVPVFGDSQASEIITMIFIVIILTAGSTLVMWLGERITEYGIGNGTSLIIFIGIISTLGLSILNAITRVIPQAVGAGDTTGIWFLLGFFLLVILLFGLIVFVDLADRKISVHYAKQIKGNKMYGGQSTHIPIKVNAGGVMPIIFASSLLMFPQMIIQFAGWGATSGGQWYITWLGVGGKLYPLLIFLLIIFFAYFYSQIQFNPDDVAKMIQSNGGFVPGIRPGKPTSEYLKKINNRIVLFGALFLAFVAIIPTFILKLDGFASLGLSSTFSATGLLIVVSVALEFEQQLESQLLVKHNKGFLK
ncbi:MAG: preprotein translocase subunit SecY [Christensenellales bacterium]|jgi:preprotein translocase subunit SecY